MTNKHLLWIGVLCVLVGWASIAVALSIAEGPVGALWWAGGTAMLFGVLVIKRVTSDE